ncbi:formate dehydrogenase subunit delta [Saccharopolyspora sp. TS4A08]|uniref:Formate dehydrogenase subunit delta n=1 Tax=Saccharopolyspora ipomoeae TaxID=3042027 RepID=A0ABT6PGN8_9PSEU|nr:formate dehydrogenase subunit delta [Saccharopolyspora sp. TS4A08]MDI2027155.1 formate dehydrogenase subunit delta [Saccharopolyspora sp. TS4A08]
MSDDVSPQVRMANDIAIQFAHLPPRQAAREVAHHIRMFWDPRMRTELDQLVDTPPQDLDPLALEAARLLRNAHVTP